jgi:hypothetical protein
MYAWRHSGAPAAPPDLRIGGSGEAPRYGRLSAVPLWRLLLDLTKVAANWNWGRAYDSRASGRRNLYLIALAGQSNMTGSHKNPVSQLPRGFPSRPMPVSLPIWAQSHTREALLRRARRR